MNKFIAGLICAFLTICGLSAIAGGVYQEDGGLIVIEAENTDSALGNWEQQASLTGYTGEGHLQFLGNAYTTGPADSPLEYTFKVETAGIYALHLRASKTNIVEGAETRTDVANDCYVRVEGDYNAGPGPYDSEGNNASLDVLQSDTKYYTYTESATDNWKWEDGIGNGNGNLIPSEGFRDAIYDFKAGETYTLVVSGRSKFFRLDRIVFRHESVTASAAQSLTLPESEQSAGDRYVYAATEDFPSYEDGVVPYYKHTAEGALAIAANIVEYRDLFATASRTFDGSEGTYDVTITALRELDGECVYQLWVNGAQMGEVKNSETTVDYAPQNHLFRNITIPAGATIAVKSKTDTNGKIPEGDEGGTAWARGRWTELSLVPSELSLLKPPAGRIALVSDGNSPDPDDIGAKAVAFAILKASGLSDRLVHVSHSCDLDPFHDASGGVTRIDVPNELRRQTKLHELTGEGFNFFGPFNNVADYYNCRSNLTEAVADLTAAIDASTAEDPLWIIEGGEPDVIGYALSNSVESARAFVHVISHHPANDNSGDYWTWPEIQAFGIIEHQIGDQNGQTDGNKDLDKGLQTYTNYWDWALNNSDPGIAWIWDQLKYAEQDGVVTFQDDKFDCSDAGMMYWWITGANAGGNSNSTPVEIKAMLLGENSIEEVTSHTQVLDEGEWNAATTWSSGTIPETGHVYATSMDLNVNDASSSFGGDSLTIQSTGWLRLRDSANTFVVDDLIMSGGRIYAATGGNVTYALDGNIDFAADTLVQAYWSLSNGPRNLNLLSKISGSATVTSLASNADSTHALFVDNAENDFSGTWISQNGYLMFNNAGAVGTADIEVQANGKLAIDGDWNTDAILTVADAATASIDIGGNAWSVRALFFGNVDVPRGKYSAVQLNNLGSNPVFTGEGRITVLGPPPPDAVIAGWDTWSSSTTPVASVLAPNVTATAVTTTGQNPWNTTDERGASNDGTWGTHVGPPTASTAVVDGENLTLLNASTDGTITFTVSNNGDTDIELGAFHFDAYAFRPKAPRTYELSVLAGSDITVGTIYTSSTLEITSVGGANANDAHDSIDHSLLELADHTLAAGESVDFLLAFSDGTGSGGGHNLYVDNVAVTQVVVVDPVAPPVMEFSMSGEDMVFSWTAIGFKVQSRTNLTAGTWNDYPGNMESPVTINPTEDVEYFRLIEQ